MKSDLDLIFMVRSLCLFASLLYVNWPWHYFHSQMIHFKFLWISLFLQSPNMIVYTICYGNYCFGQNLSHWPAWQVNFLFFLSQHLLVSYSSLQVRHFCIKTCLFISNRCLKDPISPSNLSPHCTLKRKLSANFFRHKQNFEKLIFDFLPFFKVVLGKE